MWRLVLVAAAFAGCVLGGRGTQEPGVRGALRAMLGLGLGTPPTGEDRAGRSAYMMELYKRYTSEGATNGTEANTVRSIQATVGRVGGQRVFLFNVSSVKESEEVLKAELHVFRKKKKRRFAIAIKLRRLSGGRLHELGSPREISRDSYGWQSRDVSGDVSACMTQRRRRNLVLAATFSARRRNGRQVALRMAKFMRHMSPPFLVVFSKDAQNITLDQIDTRRAEDGGDSSFVHPESGRAERVGGRRMAKRGAEPDADEASTDGVARSRRSIFDNEIPEDPTKRVVDPPSDYSVPRSHPSILQGRTQYRKRVSKSRLLPYPPEFERRRRRRKHHRKQRRRNRLTYGMMGTRWANRDGASAKAFNDVSDATDTAHLCRRRKLVVDFADIGWSEWVISPKSFEAHYCAGACPFPMAQKLRPSNHATIQSLVQAVGLYSDVPAPCCVPEALSSVTLLYFDENQNVVLKNYPAMTVQSCACR